MDESLSSSINDSALQPGKIIGQKFKLEDKIGQGSFGMIFKCINTENQESCAIKLEKRNERHSSMLVREIKVMMEVKNEKGFARLSGYGKEDDFNYVAMSYLGRNLDSLIKKCGGKFTMQTTLNVFEQCLKRLQSLHSKNLIHRDIKPENFVIGYGQSYNVVHLIDFGLAKYFIDSEGSHIPFFEKKGMIGTARYASINAHAGFEQSRRDDLEGLGYIIIYFVKGKLPWQSVFSDNKDDKYDKIKTMKSQYMVKKLCDQLPKEFQEYFTYVSQLKFDQAPDYEFLHNLIKKMVQSQNIQDQNKLDWDILPEYRARRKSSNQQNIDVNDSKQNIKQGQGQQARNEDRRQSNLLLVPQKEDKISQQPSINSNVDNTSRMNIYNFQSNLSNNSSNNEIIKQLNTDQKENNKDKIEQNQKKTNGKQQQQQQIQMEVGEEEYKNNDQNQVQASLHIKQSPSSLTEVSNEQEHAQMNSDYHKKYKIQVMSIKPSYKNDI